MTWSKTLQVHWIDRWILQSTDQKSTVYWKVKLWLFGQNQVPRITIHQKISKFKTKSSIFDSLMKKFHILTCFDELWSLALDFDQKVKVWLFNIQLIFDQLTANFICQSNGFAMFWTMSLGKNGKIGLLRSLLKPIDHLLGQKSEIALSQSKP